MTMRIRSEHITEGEFAESMGCGEGPSTAGDYTLVSDQELVIESTAVLLPVPEGPGEMDQEPLTPVVDKDGIPSDVEDAEV